jgi:FKBP-type peptidyl-prolyl cis-trans isomerase SlyD
MIIDDNAVVSMSYRLLNGDGDVIDSSQGQLPLVYMHNSNSILASLERELTGKVKEDTVDVVIYPEDGYGYAKEELIQELPREQFKDIPGLTVGQRIRATNKENNEVEMLSVVEIRDDTVLVDFNHPLAGQVLNFQIVIVDVREPTEKEREQGFASTTKPLL